jgi:hypothetical protein
MLQRDGPTCEAVSAGVCGRRFWQGEARRATASAGIEASVANDFVLFCAGVRAGRNHSSRGQAVRARLIFPASDLIGRNYGT